MKEKTMNNKISILQAKAYITEINNLIILFIMNIKRTDDYALTRNVNQFYHILMNFTFLKSFYFADQSMIICSFYIHYK